MNKLFRIFLVMIILGGYTLLTPSSGQASGLASPPQQQQDFTSFAALQLNDELMLGPYSDYQVRFGVPASWQLAAGAGLVLDLEVTSSQTASNGAGTQGTTNNAEFTGATLDVTYNDVTLGVIPLKNGSQTVEMPFPVGALVPSRSDGRHDLLLFLNAAVDCVYPQETSVVVRAATSGFILPHTIVSPTLALNTLPKPIYQLDSIQPSPLLIVLPDQPSPQEVQAGITVAAGLGRMTNNIQMLSTESLGQLTDTQKSSSHILFVGKAASLPVLSSVAFPAAISGGSIAVNGINTSDGVVQMAISPWNPELAVIYVGGSDDNAVVKAAQALSSSQLRPGTRPDLSVVTSVDSAVDIPAVDTDRTLESLGFVSQQATGIGYQSLEYNFYVPFGQVAGSDAYFDLVYSHSALLDFSGSGVLVIVNNQTIGSLRLTEETSKSINTTRISIPAYVVHPGFNNLSVQMEFVPTNYCSEINRDGLWLTVHQNSNLHLPLIPAPVNVLDEARDLSQYPAMFTLNPSLNNLGFVVAQSDSQTWDIAAQIASFLGKDATGTILSPAIVFGDSIPDEIRQTRDLIVVGRASELPFISELGDALPAPFNPGSDIAIENGMQISYLIPEGTNLGYLQLMAAPWDTNRTILAVMGSTPVGLGWSGASLVNLDQIRLLRGTFAVVTDTQILTADTRLGLGTQNLAATAVPGDYPGIATEPVNEPGVASTYQRSSLLIPIGIVSVLTVVFLVVFLIVSKRQKK